MKNKMVTIAATLLTISSAQSFAGLIQPSANFDNYTRSCGAVSANPAQYIADWGDAMVAFGYSNDKSALTLDNACHFNGSSQGRYFDTDGSPKAGFEWAPSGVDFSVHSAGSLVTNNAAFQSYDENGNLVYQNTMSDKHQAQVTFKDQTQGNSNLLMPEIKLATYSEEGERNSTNVSAWSGFQRVAGTEDIDLQLVIDFDFFNSNEDHDASIWDATNVPGIKDYLFYLGFGAAKGIENEDNLFPDFIDIIASDAFLSNDEALAQYTQDNPFEGQIILDLSNIAVGETVYIFTNAQAFGFNGGLTDAFNTIKTKLQVAGATEEESLRILSSQFALATSTIPEPASFALFGLGLAFMLRRNRQKNGL